MVEWIFWTSACAVVYAYFGYPLLLSILVSIRSKPTDAPPADDADLPAVAVVVPVHNEVAVIEGKLANSRALQYPAGKLRVLFVSDGSTDGTVEAVRAQTDDRISLLELTVRNGKAAALNAALDQIDEPIVVFSDASILLNPDAITAIVRPFSIPEIGCVSGEDRIAGMGGEGLYGRYELFLRRKESQLESIVGASGSFYAQRRHLCAPFDAGFAPDFLSVLRTVEQGYRAITHPDAVGHMEALESTADEFRRKVRTILRGLTTLRYYAHLMNPFRHGWFAFELWSHKAARWLVPFFLMAMLAASGWLALDSTFYRVLFALQAGLYALGFIAPVFNAGTSLLVTKIAVYFATVNMATLWAWGRFMAGARQELWQPSRR